MLEMNGYIVSTITSLDPEFKKVEPFIYNSFLKSLKFGSELMREIESDNFFPYYHAYIYSVVRQKGSFIRLACLEGDLNLCLGWSLSNDSKLFYVFVKQNARRMKIGTDLLPPKFDAYMNFTKLGLQFKKKVFPLIPFTPFILPKGQANAKTI